jgi:hypothetical protein
VSALQLADGPAMYLGGSIMTFALPLGAFIVIATVLFYLYRRPHRGPGLKYLASGPATTSVMTREPGPVPAPAAKPPAEAPASADEAGESDSSAPEGTE